MIKINWKNTEKKIYSYKDKIKIGISGFWETGETFIRKEFLDVLKENGFDVDDNIYNPIQEQCDVVFVSLFDKYTPDLFKGHPVTILFTGENINPNYLETDYSLSFNPDTKTNLFYPFWRLYFDDFKKYRKPVNVNKTKFCTFIVSNKHSIFRNDAFKEICKYKKIDSIGPVFNNTGFILPRDMEKSVEYHQPYKFNLCFENGTYDNFNPVSDYITEKIINAYTYGTVPIYRGSRFVEKWFNPKSFINCNGLTIQEICEKVKYYDTHEDEYLAMLNEYPFNDKIDWSEYRHKQFIEFFRKIFPQK